MGDQSQEAVRRRAAEQSTREHFREEIMQYGNNPYIVAKKAFVRPKDGKTVCRLWVSELGKGIVFVELFDFDYNPLRGANDRKLLMISGDGEFKDRYKHCLTEKESYEIPEEEFQVVVRIPRAAAPSTGAAFSSRQSAATPQAAVKPIIQTPAPQAAQAAPAQQQGLLEDCALKDVSLRDLLAIALKEPISNKEWVNDLIRKFGHTT